MKKLLSTLLALTLLLTLSAPALAASVSDAVSSKLAYEMSEEAVEWINAHPQATREFQADLDAYVAEEWPWYSSVAEMAEDWDESEEYIRGFLTEEWVLFQIEQEEREAWKAEYEAAHPGILAALEANAYDYFMQEYFWYDSPEEYMADYGYTEEEFIADMVDEQLYELRLREEWDAWVAGYEAAHPGALAALEANAYNYFAQEYFWYGTPEEYMADYGYTEEEFIADMVEEQLNDLRLQEEQRAEWDRVKTSLGGVPGQMGVMLNGTYITFPDAIPEAVNGRIMVPYRALMEALGGDVGYDAATQTVSCILDGTTLKLVLGESTLTISENGTVSTLEMDCAAYAKNGRTYVPVRFISQAFGYDVLWDQDFETAVLLDRQALAGEIDSRFTILNRALQALTPDPEQSRETTETVKADVTLLDSIAGDKTYQFSGTVSGIVRGGSAQGEMSFDLSALNEMLDLDTLIQEYADWYELTPEESDTINGLAGSLGDLSLEYIENVETGTFYVRSPLLGLIDESWADAWLVFQADDMLLLPDELTVGSICYTLNTSEAVSGFDSPVYTAGRILEAGESLAEVLGDDCFTHTDQGDVFTLDPAILGLEDSYYYYNPFSELEFTFTVADSGAVTGSIRMVLSESGLYGLTGLTGTVLVLDGAFSLGGSSSALTMDLHVKNSFRLELEITAENTDTASVPLSEPPAGDLVIDPEEEPDI